ncbi:MAG: FHA domain-containing protein [Polyangiaceae bacterium]|nr:FHA domain-containing protein [Polyangiaceae bacterium]
MFKLVISDDEGKTTVVPLVRDEITIGRKEGNTIRLTERNVSRRHARLRRKNGAFVVEDLGSYNGVRINGDRVEGASELSAGDRVGIGDYELALQRDGVEALEAPTGMRSIASGDLAEPVPPARLVMLTAPAPGAEYALGGDNVRIGRSEDLEVWVNHRSISREHASFQREGDTIIVRDLDSANGVRLNGTDVREAELQSGDILELGQVRFRFVAEGETYVYDADDANAIDATSVRNSGPRAPAIAAALIVVVAVAAGAAIAVTSGRRSTQVTEPTTEVAPDHTALGPSSGAIARAAEAVRSCEAAVGERRYDDALRFAAEALTANPESEPAATCRVAAQEGVQEREIFARGKAALEAGEVDAAYFAFEELPLESPLRSDEAVVGAHAMFVERHLELARRALSREPNEAVRQATIVLSVEDLGDTERLEAEALIARASRRLRGRDSQRTSPSAEGETQQPTSGSGPAPRHAGPGATLASPTAGAAPERHGDPAILE